MAEQSKFQNNVTGKTTLPLYATSGSGTMTSVGTTVTLTGTTLTALGIGKYAFIYSDANCEVRQITAVTSTTVFEVSSAFTIALATETIRYINSYFFVGKILNEGTTTFTTQQGDQATVTHTQPANYKKMITFGDTTKVGAFPVAINGTSTVLTVEEIISLS